jgi:translation initiation factor 2 beta subunit (eIF-2beta)/eIF-5
MYIDRYIYISICAHPGDMRRKDDGCDDGERERGREMEGERERQHTSISTLHFNNQICFYTC